MDNQGRPSHSGADSSGLPSPTDTRHPSRLDQPSQAQAQPSQAQSQPGRDRDEPGDTSSLATDTVRRRPEPSYGSINSPVSSTQTEGPAFAPLGRSLSRSSQAPPPVTRSPLLSADRGRSRPRKPAMPRRKSSQTQGPYRGEYFSVDDGISEVEADAASRNQNYSATVIRRRTAAPPALSRVHSSRDEDDQVGQPQQPEPPKAQSLLQQQHQQSISSPQPSRNVNEGRDSTVAMAPTDRADDIAMTEDPGENDGMPEDEGSGDAEMLGGDDLDPGDISDAESFTLKDRQQAINETHPFGIRLWKPALYKKDRSVQKTAEVDIHSTPGGHVSKWLLFFNIVWTLAFGWWMALIAFFGAVTCFLFVAAPSALEYGRVLWGLAGYILYPFGKPVRLEQQEAYLDEDEGEGRSISEYEQWQSGDLEYGRLFFGPERASTVTGSASPTLKNSHNNNNPSTNANASRNITTDNAARSIVGRSRRSMDSEPDETDSLLGRGRGRAHAYGQASGGDDNLPRLMKRRLFGRGQWNIGRVIFFTFFYFLIMPSLFATSIICWFLVFWIPMGKVTMLLLNHLRRHPLALNFDSDIATARDPAAPHSSIIVCTYRAVGLKYWKYTVDGTNIFLINLMGIVGFVIFDWLVLDGVLNMESFVTSPAFLFVAGLFSIIPLAYFIGQAVASISAQSSMGLGAAINAFFSTIVEVFLYCVALRQGKARLVEGSIVGSIFAGILFLPGVSMCFGAIKRKTQRFNSQSAGVTSTMLLFAVIGAFGPTLFYQIYGTHELNCQDCITTEPLPHHGGGGGGTRDCRRCYFSQTPAINDRFYLQAVRPYSYLAAGLLFLSYIIGLWFTLRTHATVIWNTDVDEKKHDEQHGSTTAHNTPRPCALGGSVGESIGVDIRDSHLYKRILGQSLRHVGLLPRSNEQTRHNSQTVPAPSSNNAAAASTASPGPHLVPPKSASGASGTCSAETPGAGPSVHIPGLSESENNTLVHQVAEIAATAATVAARDARLPRHLSAHGTSVSTAAAHPSVSSSNRPAPARGAAFHDAEDMGESTAAAGHSGGGHDAPNWSRLKSAIILMSATVLYAIIAEILVDTVDVVLQNFAIDEKFLGITLFALVPNTTEFLNAISFAMNGNIALSMEIGSAYALQVCLLQIPALVLFSAVYPPGVPVEHLGHYTFSLLFPQWDMVTVILCVFLLSYMYGEGKSNYFKGSILLLSYLVVVVGFYFSSFTANIDNNLGSPISRFDTMSSDGQWMSYGFKTVGRSTNGIAY